MTHLEIRTKFLEYFKSKGHAVVPSSSLLPTDPSVLFTTAGMQQFKPYYTGAADAHQDFGSLNTASIQKCIRTSDIDEVGDDSHHTFFQMMGNFSFGGYWKKEAITYAYEFITKELNLPISYVSIFEGAQGVPKDEESRAIWQALGVTDIRESGMDEVFWGPTGNDGPCGPTTEIYCRNAKGQDVEIWNIVFNEFFCDSTRENLLAGTAKLSPLPTKGIDTGMGMERLAMIVQQKESNYDTDLFASTFDALPKDLDSRVARIIADHIRAHVFLTADGVFPSNKEQGYILRRLLRRVMLYEKLHNLSSCMEAVITGVVDTYASVYPELSAKREDILGNYAKEREKFTKTLTQGLKELERLETIEPASAFKLYESFGLPFEIIKEVGKEKAAALTLEGFETEQKRHQEISRAGAEKKFGGHGITVKEGDLAAENQDEMVKKTRLHTATHIVVAALEKVLGEKLKQAGSDITVDRLRFDFAFPRKVTPEELKQAEGIANEVVAKDLPVSWEEMNTDDAFGAGASGAFRHKYGDRVKVYTIGDKAQPFSKEICGGPHVTHAGEVGHITITKEESVSGGNRRIRATVE